MSRLYMSRLYMSRLYMSRLYMNGIASFAYSLAKIEETRSHTISMEVLEIKREVEKLQERLGKTQDYL